MTEQNTNTKPAVFLDRDGVLCQAVVRVGRPCAPASLAELHLMPGARLVCEALQQAGYLLVMISNQPDIARGTQRRETVDIMNLWLRTELSLDAIQVCPHQESDACACRKPAPGMITEAAQLWDIDLTRSFMVGDRPEDIEAGRAAGCQTVFINHRYQEQPPGSPNFVAQSLLEAAEDILLSTPQSTANAAADFLKSMVERTRAVAEFHQPVTVRA